MIRIGIVHDRAESHGLFQELIEDIGYQLAWTAVNSEQALARCKQDLPELVLVKLSLPDADGVDIIRAIMQQSPTTIIAVSQSARNQTAKVFEAMSVGALDAFTEPVDRKPESISEFKRKIRNVGKLHTSATQTTRTVQPHIEKDLPLIAIGASTGGPAALVKVLSKLPEKPNAVIVIIQHMDNQFSAGMARWINDQTPMPVEIARARHTPEAGIAYIAGTDDHLVLDSNGRFKYISEPEDYPYRPSVDVFFNSAVANWPNRMIGVLLTGMGRDGAGGLLSFYNRGMLTIAQDQQSCAVFGMPKAAIALHAAGRVLHIDEIGDAIREAL